MNRGYAKIKTLSGSIRASVLPAMDDAGTQVFAPIQSLEYCSGPWNSTLDHRLPCVSFDPERYSAATTDLGLLIGTRVKRQQQPRNSSCTEDSYGCSEWLTDGPTSTFYIGDVSSPADSKTRGTRETRTGRIVATHRPTLRRAREHRWSAQP